MGLHRYRARVPGGHGPGARTGSRGLSRHREAVSTHAVLLFLYFISLLVQALLERELRHAMVAAGVDHLPVYPEERECRAPSTERILEVFGSLQRHDLWAGDRRVQTFPPQVDALQEPIVTLPGTRPGEFTT